MSGAQTSTFGDPNILLNTLSGMQTTNVAHNQLLNAYDQQTLPYRVQEEQQKVGGADMAVVGQASLGLLNNYTDEASRAAAYPGVVKALQDAGYARNAPSQYPGEAALRQLSSMAISPEQQYQLGIIVPPGLAKALGGGQPQAGAPGGGGLPPAGTPFVAKNLPQGVTPEEDQIVRTVWGEANGQPLAGQQAVASVIKNRAKMSGQSTQDVIFAKNQFEPWNTARRAQLEALDPSDPQYQAILKNVVRPVMAGQVQDPTGGATYFLNPDLVRSRGDPIPSWASGNATRIGAHTFYYGPYGGGGQQQVAGAPGTPPPAAPGATQTATATPQVQIGGAPPAPPGAAPGAAAAPTVSLGAALGAPGASPALQPPLGPQATPPRKAADAIVGGMNVAQASPLVRGTGQEAGPSSAVATVATPSAPWAATPGAGAASYSDSPTIPQPPQNGLTPGQPGAPPAPQPPAAAPAPPAAAQAPAGGPVQIPGTGINSPQYQQFQAIQRQIDQLMPYAALPAAKAKIAQLQAQQNVLMQMDSVVTLPDGRQVHTLTGKVDNAAEPLAHYVFDPNAGGQGVPGFVDTTGTHEPKISPARRLVQRPDGTVIDDTGRVVSPADLPGAQAAAAAKAAGTATGTAVAKQLPALIDQGRGAAQAIGNIDYGLGQIEKAKQGGIPTGYFAPWVATLGAIGKSIGGDVGERIATLGADPSAIGNIQTAGKTLAVVSGAILEQILGPGSQITDAKIQHFIHAQPGIETDPEALNRVLNWARSQFVYEQEMARAGVTEAAKSPTGTLPLNWQAQYFRDKGFAPIYNPTTGEMEQPEGRSPSREPPAATPATAPVNPAARTAGTTYNTPKGPMKWTGTGWLPAQ